MGKSDAIVSGVSNVESLKHSRFNFSITAVRLIQKAVSQQAILYSSFFVSIAEPVKQWCLMGDKPTFIRCFHHLNLLIVCVCYVEGFVRLAVMNTEWVLKLGFIAHTFSIAKVKQLRLVLVCPSDIQSILAVDVDSANRRRLRVGNEECWRVVEVTERDS